MKLIIDISEEDYNNIEPFLNGQKIKGGFNLFNVLEIIKNGIPLPRGHGRLKDVDKIISDGIHKGFCDWYDEMKYAATIVEADKAESDDYKVFLELVRRYEMTEHVKNELNKMITEEE